MSRRMLIAIGIVLMIALGGNLPATLAAAPPKPITITWWINPWRIAPPGFPADKAPTAEDFPKWASEEFMRLNPNVTVKYEVVTTPASTRRSPRRFWQETRPTCCAP